MHVGTRWKIQDRKQIINTDNSSASYNTQPEKEVGLFYNAPEPTRGFWAP